MKNEETKIEKKGFFSWKKTGFIENVALSKTKD